LPIYKTDRYTAPGNGVSGEEEGVDPSDHDQNEPHNGAPASDHEPTHANAPLGEGWLRSVVENSSEIVTVVDPDGTLRYANPAWERALGYDPEQAIGAMNVLDHVHPEDLADVLEETEKALDKGGIVTNEAEYRFRRKDGSWLWIQSVGTYLLDDPAVNGVVVASRDVTERKEAEEALRRSEAEVFSVLESITDGFFSLDQEMRFAYVNPQAELLLGRSREDLVGEIIWEDPTFYPYYLRAVAEGETVEFEGYYPPLEAWYGVRAYPSASGLSVYFQDITERKEAEERLRFQAQLLRAVGEAVIALDVEGRVLYWNRAAEEMYGWSSEQIMGRRLREMVVPEELQGRAEEIAEELREGRIWAGEFEVRRRDGTTFPVEGTDTPVFGEDGDLVGVIGVLRNITERKETEEALRKSEARFHALVQNALDIVMVTDAQGAIRYVSPSVERVLGYRAEEVIGTVTAEYVHPDDLQGALTELSEAVSKPGVHPVAVETRVRHKDGSWRHLEGIANNLLDDPVVEGMVFNHRDVTERNRAEEEVRRLNEELENRVKERTARLEAALAELGASEERYRLLVESAEDYAIFMVDTDGRVLDWNMGAQRIFGYRESEIVGELGSMLFTPEDVRSGVPERELRKAREEGRAVDERRHVRKDGSKFWASGFVRPMRDDFGNLRGFAKVARDITERKRAEEALRDIREAERSRIARDLHDGVLQDLSYTSAAIGLLMLQAEEAKLKEQLQAAIDAVRRGAQGLREVVNDLRLEDEEGRPFAEVVESLVRRNRTMAKHVEISMEVGERVPATPLGETGMQASRIIQEALTNARRHSGAKRISVSLRTEGEDLVAEVTDDGAGFGPDALPGVGLGSMRERAALVGGELEIESGEERGTSVRLKIPLPQGTPG
jgi:PAS domain S-box-containing protein